MRKSLPNPSSCGHRLPALGWPMPGCPIPSPPIGFASPPGIPAEGLLSPLPLPCDLFSPVFGFASPPLGVIGLPPIAFESSPDDAPVYVLAPPSLPSDALARNIQAIADQGGNLHLVHDPAEIPRGGGAPPLVLNWGASDSLPADLVVLKRIRKRSKPKPTKWPGYSREK